MDAFFAAVEQRDNPELRGKPIAVGFDGPRGVVSTASYEARRFGVHSAQSIAQAKRLCPDLNIVPCRHEHYKEVSQQIHHIFQDYTDLIEPISIDEAFLDVTHNKKGIELAVDVAREIKARIKAETGLTASAGISYCKFLAKVASDYRKPDGSLGYFQNMHCVYNKTGQKCPGCTCNIAQTGGIKKIVQAGRSTFYCPVKQK